MRHGKIPQGTHLLRPAPAADENHYDDLDGDGPVAIFDGPSLYPEYLSDLNVIFCPSSTHESAEFYIECPAGKWCTQATDHPNFGKLDAGEIEDKVGYLYYGYLAENVDVFSTLVIGVQIPGDLEDQLPWFDNDMDLEDYLAIIQPYIDGRAAEIGLPPGTAIAQGNNGGTKILRLREGVERFLITDINNPAGSAQSQSTMAIMWDHIEAAQPDNPERVERFNHVPGGCNVLYMDGHSEFLKYPSDEHPVTKMNAATGAGV